MKTLNSERRIEIVGRHLRLMAGAIEAAQTPAEVRAIAVTLQAAMSLINLCLYDYQKALIENAKYDIDLKEAA